MYSIRERLSYSIIIGMTLLLSIGAFFLYQRVSHQVEQVFDTGLYDKAQALISLTELDEEGLEFDFAEDGVMLEFVGGEAPQYYQLWDTGLLIKSPTLGAAELPRLGVATSQHRFADLVLADGRAGRLIEIGFIPRIEVDDDEDEAWRGEVPEAKPITLVFARERESLDDSLSAVRLTVLGVFLAVLIVSALSTRRLVGRGLAPLSDIAGQVGEIDESNLGVRISQHGEQSVEISPIEDQVNHLLERLQSAFERERRFSANVAHELRTPLSELRTLTEVSRMIPPEADQLAEFFDDVGDISAQMEKVVLTLLELARSEAGLLQSDPEDIPLAAYCDEIWRHATNHNGRSSALVNAIPDGIVIHSDREKLGIILSNLFVNALSYGPHDSEVRVRSGMRNGQWVLEVENTALDLEFEDMAHMKDRFWRKRRIDDGSGHSGLGLTLVEALAKVLDLDVSLSLDRRQIFTVTVGGLKPATQ